MHIAPITVLEVTMSWMTRLATATVAAGLLAVGAGFGTAQAAAAPAAIAAPGSLKVARTGADASTLDITWKAVPGAARYTVAVFDGTTQQATSVDAATTHFTFAGSGACTRYRVNVTAIDPAGVTAVTNDYLLAPLAPGGITNLQVTRSADATTADLTWAAPPAGSSVEPVAGYAVAFRSLSTGEVLSTTTTTTPSAHVGGLDPARIYVADITPTNRLGSCSPSKVLVRGPQPSAPTGLTVLRDSADKHMVTVSWAKPSWTGYAPVTKMQIGVRNPAQANPTWIDLPADATSASVKLPNTSKWSVWVRAVSGNTYGEISKEYIVEKPGTPGQPVANPKITVSETDGNVNVTFSGPAGSSATYPNMRVTIAPSVEAKTNNGNHTAVGQTKNDPATTNTTAQVNANKQTTAGTGQTTTFTEKQNVFNRAQTLTFRTVPCGTYTITVTGFGGTASTELARLDITRCATK